MCPLTLLFKKKKKWKTIEYFYFLKYLRDVYSTHFKREKIVLPHNYIIIRKEILIPTIFF